MTMTATADGFEALHQALLEIGNGEEWIALIATIRRDVARSCRGLTREQRRRYWSLRVSGMAPLDAIIASRD